ncbi:hypothetical protein SDC9_130053 [bioreactor metagenome]|uniref:Uncharacterized protein n=1 Tax=bioreactor metagenome TaxID=1076179 RepID=A0A645D0G1_9ZZZZ
MGVVIAIPEPGNQLRIVAGTNAPFRLGVRLGAEGASLNIITAMEALDEKTVLVMSEGAVLRVNLP